jgi:hypothetical protein
MTHWYGKPWVLGKVHVILVLFIDEVSPQPNREKKNDREILRPNSRRKISGRISFASLDGGSEVVRRMKKKKLNRGEFTEEHGGKRIFFFSSRPSGLYTRQNLLWPLAMLPYIITRYRVLLLGV